jgi:TonB family protein
VPGIPETASAKVTLKITVDDAGVVAEARPTAIVVRSAAFDISAAGDNLYAAIDRQTSSMTADVAWNARKAATAVMNSAMTSVEAWRYDPPAQAPLTFSVSVVYGEPEPTPSTDEKALRVGGGIAPPMKIRDVRPVYPPEALAAGIEGVVILETKIGADGSVEEARVLKSVDKQIDQAAIDAVRQWKFDPTLMNGQAVPIIMTVAINFTKQ